MTLWYMWCRIFELKAGLGDSLIDWQCCLKNDPVLIQKRIIVMLSSNMADHPWHLLVIPVELMLLHEVAAQSRVCQEKHFYLDQHLAWECSQWMGTHHPECQVSILNHNGFIVYARLSSVQSWPLSLWLLQEFALLCGYTRSCGQWARGCHKNAWHPMVTFLMMFPQTVHECVPCDSQYWTVISFEVKAKMTAWLEYIFWLYFAERSWNGCMKTKEEHAWCIQIALLPTKTSFLTYNSFCINKHFIFH